MSIGGGRDGGYGGRDTGGYSNNLGGGSSAYGLPPTGAVNRGSSQPPIQSYGMGGGFARSNYTQSEAGESDFDTHS